MSLFDHHEYSLKSALDGALVMESLERGYKLIIDPLTLSKYPFEKHESLYKRYGKVAKNLEFRGLLESDLDELFPTFPNIIALTLVHLSIVGFRSYSSGWTS